MSNDYNTETSFWQDAVSSHGIDEAISICERYLDMRSKEELSDEAKQSCRYLFW